MCVGVALFHLDDPLSLLAHLLIACIVGLIAAGVEVAVRFELRLINNGRVADAIVDGLTRTRNGFTVDYHFFAEDGRAIEGSSTVATLDTDLWPIGRQVPVIYDADRPTRHKIQERFWFVEWEIAESRVKKNGHH